MPHIGHNINYISKNVITLSKCAIKIYNYILHKSYKPIFKPKTNTFQNVIQKNEYVHQKRKYLSYKTLLWLRARSRTNLELTHDVSTLSPQAPPLSSWTCLYLQLKFLQFSSINRVLTHLDRTESITMAFQGSGELEDQIEEPEDTLRVSPAEEMPVDGPPAVEDPDPEPLLLPWDRFSTWLHCICVVGFDLELGQAVEVQKTVIFSAVCLAVICEVAC